MASYVSYILVSNKKKERKKNCADCILLTQTNNHTSATPTHAYTFTKIFTSITNPICLFFFVVFLISFF